MENEHIVCPNCQKQIQDHAFCSHCGYKIDDPVPEKQKSDSKHAQRKTFVRKWIMPIVFLLVIIAFGILGLGLKGFRDGTEEQLLEKQHQADIHYNRGDVWTKLEQYEMAEAEFREALRLVPDYPNAQEALELAQARQTVTPSPSPTTAIEAIPTNTRTPPTATPHMVVVPAKEILFEEAAAHYQKKEWEEAISKLTQVQQLDSVYEAEQVKDMLFESHYQYGLELDEEGALEDAIAHYAAALQIQPRVQEIEDQRRWADLYLRALGGWEINWESVIKNLTSIYIQKPEYKDTAPRLYAACVEQGQAMSDQLRWCNAAELYEQAIEIYDQDNTVAEQENETLGLEQVTEMEQKTRYLCQTVEPVPQETRTTEGEWPLWQDLSMGTLVASCYDYKTGTMSICYQNAKDNLLYTWITQTEQPALTWDGSLLAYRSTSPDKPGLYAVKTISMGVTISPSETITWTEVISLEMSNGPITITTDVEAQYPTWSPDGKSVAFTVYDPEKEDWFIHIADLETLTSRRIHQGQWPNWSINGQLAFAACQGENHCGIYLYNPDSEQINKLTASAADKAPVWSPDGQTLVYMSDVGEVSSNIYGVDLNGYVWQITKNVSTDVAPVWSPDGNLIAYVTNHRLDWTVYVTPPRGDYLQKERITILGAESAEWTKFRLNWISSILEPVE